MLCSKLPPNSVAYNRHLFAFMGTQSGQSDRCCRLGLGLFLVPPHPPGHQRHLGCVLFLAYGRLSEGRALCESTVRDSAYNTSPGVASAKAGHVAVRKASRGGKHTCLSWKELVM